MSKSTILFWGFIALSAFVIQFIIVSANIGDVEKKSLANKSLKPSLQMVQNYYYFYNANRFDIINKHYLYQPPKADQKKLQQVRSEAFEDFRNTYGKYRGQVYDNSFRFLNVCGENFRFFARRSMPAALQSKLNDDPRNFLNTYCVNIDKKPNQVYINVSSKYDKGTDKTNGFTLTIDEKGNLKILKFPVRKEKYGNNLELNTL